MTKLRYDPPRTPGGHLPSDAWHRQDRLDNEDLAKIIAERAKQTAGEVDAPATKRLVGIGTRVRVRDCDTRETAEYEIVGAGESHPTAGRISGESPVGSALLAHRAGEIVLLGKYERHRARPRSTRYKSPWRAGKPGRLSSTTGWRRCSALRLSYFTIAWNGVVGATALVVGLTTDSLALAGFALNALLDSSASVVLVWRFRKERSDAVAAEHLERRAQTWVIVAMVIVALFVGIEAVRALVNGSHPGSSAFGFGIAAISLMALPVLGVMKLRLAGRLGSPALRGDGVLTLAAVALAAITLVALLANSLLDWWWADPAAALVIAIALVAEATRVTVRHRFG